MKIAVVDIGSNTIKMKIFEVVGQKLNEVYSEVRNTKLISYISDSILSPDGIFLLCKTICELKLHANNEGYDSFTCFATASLRRAENIDEITKAVFDISGEKIDLVSGSDEAFYSFSGVKNTSEIFPDNAILLDMGGGSTEIVLCKNGDRVCSDSMNFGSLSLYLDNPGNNFARMKKSAVDTLKRSSVYPVTTDNAILVGGTSLAINRLYMHFYTDAEEYIMTFDRLNAMYERLKKYDEETISLLKSKVPDRVTTVIPGLSAYVGIFEECSVKNIMVSICGIREGYVFEKILKGTACL